MALILYLVQHIHWVTKNCDSCFIYILRLNIVKDIKSKNIYIYIYIPLKSFYLNNVPANVGLIRKSMLHIWMVWAKRKVVIFSILQRNKFQSWNSDDYKSCSLSILLYYNNFNKYQLYDWNRNIFLRLMIIFYKCLLSPHAFC